MSYRPRCYCGSSTLNKQLYGDTSNEMPEEEEGADIGQSNMRDTKGTRAGTGFFFCQGCNLKYTTALTSTPPTPEFIPAPEIPDEYPPLNESMPYLPTPPNKQRSAATPGYLYDDSSVAYGPLDCQFGVFDSTLAPIIPPGALPSYSSNAKTTCLPSCRSFSVLGPFQCNSPTCISAVTHLAYLEQCMRACLSDGLPGNNQDEIFYTTNNNVEIEVETR